MMVSSIMTPGVETVMIDGTVKQAAERMRQLNVGSLPVKSDGSISGILTDRDITVRAIAYGRDPNHTRVGEIMSVNVNWIYDDQGVEDAAKKMREKQVRRLLVKSRDGRLVGIISLGDISTSSSPQLAGETVRDISEPSRPER